MASVKGHGESCCPHYIWPCHHHHRKRAGGAVGTVNGLNCMHLSFLLSEQVVPGLVHKQQISGCMQTGWTSI